MTQLTPDPLCRWCHQPIALAKDGTHYWHILPSGGLEYRCTFVATPEEKS